MKKIFPGLIFKKYRKSLIGFFMLTICALSLSFGFPLSFANKTDFGSRMANIIRNNNKINGEGQTYWRCEPIESRRDWLGWGVKSYLTALANPWATYGEQENNNCFLFTNSSMNQTFIRNSSTNELIPVSVFSSPSSRSLSCFDIKLTDNKTVNTKYDFYCSESVANALGNELNDAELVVDCGTEEVSTISFGGIVKTFGYDFVNDFLGEEKNFIVVPYILKTNDGEEIISYDIKRYTGQSSFYAILKNDKYENNFYSLSIDAIYQMGGVKNKLCYKGTFIDSFDDLLKNYENISSTVQNDYLLLYNGGSGDSLNIIAGVVLIIFGIASTVSIVLLRRKNNLYSLSHINVFASFSFSLVIYWFIGEIMYNSDVSGMFFWGIGSRIFSFICVLVTATLVIISLNFFAKERRRVNDVVEYTSIDI